MTHYVCVNGHDRCYGGTSAGPECPYCEKRPATRRQLAPQRPWWETARANSDAEAETLCRRLGTGQCAAICLSHLSGSTTDGQCPERLRVWQKADR